MGEEARQSPVERREGDMKIPTGSWCARVALLFYSSYPSILYMTHGGPSKDERLIHDQLQIHSLLGQNIVRSGPIHIVKYKVTTLDLLISE